MRLPFSPTFKWSKSKSVKLGKLKVFHGKEHRILGIYLKIINGGIFVGIKSYVYDMVKTFLTTIIKFTSTPASSNLFRVVDKLLILEEDHASIFHITTGKGLFLCKWALPDILTMIVLLTSRGKKPTEEDWEIQKTMWG